MHEADYIKTNDGHWGVVVGGTKNFIDTMVDFGDFILDLRFSLQTHRQYNSQNRTFEWVAYRDVK